jgi:hypothetical protein
LAVKAVIADPAVVLLVAVDPVTIWLAPTVQVSVRFPGHPSYPVLSPAAFAVAP